MSGLSGLVDFTGEVVLVTGASRGIGRAIAVTFAQAGAKVALAARSADRLGEVAGEVMAAGGEALELATDVAVKLQVDQAVERVVTAWGRVDVLVNNAGLIEFGRIDQIEPEAWDQVIAANLTGPYLCCRAVAPIMEQQKRGRIINITSVSARTGGASGGVNYTASKGGLDSMTKTLARDLAPQGITVNAICPGQIDADPKLLTAEQRERVLGMIPLGRLGEPEEIAYAALFLASPMADYITGASLDVNGGVYKG